MRIAVPQKIKNFSPKAYWKEILAFIVILLAFVFFRSERKELQTLWPQLRAADVYWILTGVAVTFIYVLLQGIMYIKSFKAIGLELSLKDSIELFLKRNFLSVFLPAGGVTSLAYTPSQLRKKQLNTTQIHQASAIYAYVGLLTVFIIGVPIILYTLAKNNNFGNAWVSLVVLGLILAACYFVVWSFRSRGRAYQYLHKKFPSVAEQISAMFSGNVNRRYLLENILYSTLIEICGIAHVFIAMHAFNASSSFEAAAVGYTVSVVLMIISPFLRGLGAVEFTMLLIFEAYGYPHAAGLGITLLYRFFEFWLPLLLGFLSFIWRGRHLMARIGPAIAIFILGLINILSVATPPLAERLKIEHAYIPAEAVHASKLMVLMLGISLLITAAYLIKGMKAAWTAGIVLASLSLIGNIVKAFDYEEAILSAMILIVLVASYKQYRIKSSIKWLRIGITTFVTALIIVCIFDFLSFYLIDKRHFGIDFTWRQSVYYTAKSFLLFSDDELKPLTVFGRDFLNITKFLGFGSWLLLIFAILRPRINIAESANTESYETAKNLLEHYGKSPVDYFKISAEKELFFSKITEGFVSYRIANSFAIVLEGPVSADEDKVDVLEEFEQYCKRKGLKTAYYRVDENDVYLFAGLRKQKMLLGQEAIMEVEKFKLEGKDKKSLRNGLNSLEKKGYTTKLFSPPYSDEFLDELEKVSTEWLEEFKKKEMVFSQGMFDKELLKNQHIIAVQDGDGAVQAFLNIIPDYMPDECTYDLIRRTTASPGGCMDALIVKFWEYAKEKGYKYLNLGLVPLSGIPSPGNPAEQIMKFASQNVGGLKHYQSLKDFKEKYATIWENKYLVFDSDFDLLQVPQALNKVMKPPVKGDLSKFHGIKKI